MTGFAVVWLVAILVNGEWRTGKFIEPDPIETREACERHIGAHEQRMADWARGNLGASWSHETITKGYCDPIGKDA